MKTADLIYTEIIDTLRKQYQTNKHFRDELDNLSLFYGRKFMNKTNDEEERLSIIKQMDDMVKSQFFQGYYIMKSILLDKETSLPQDVWSLNPGLVRNEIPLLFADIFKDSPDNWHLTDVSQNIGLDLVQRFNNVYDLVKQTRKDLALYGAYKAFIEDDRYQSQTDNNQSSMILGNPFDLTFLSPQVYMQAQFLTEEQEIWDLNLWSSLGTKWVGSIHFSRIPHDQMTLFLFQFSVSEVIQENERYELLEKSLENIPQEIKSLMQVRLHHVRELEVVLPLKKNE
ncbi:hypothetical protein ACFWGC_25975 [Cytobacillus pseudoceanisediminis]|uniref:hypothetical protein n=1 Tax=Cytobacillus pseudoceanisediminis TaxID=3051614 RepID=UPI0036659991